MLAADKVEIERAVRAQLFGGQVKALLSAYTAPGSLLPDKTGLALTDMLVSFAEHKIGAQFSVGSEQRQHLAKIGTLQQRMKDIADGNATTLLRAADKNIQKVLGSVLRSR